MSTHDSGLGRQASRPSEFESDFADPQNTPGDEAWRVGGANTQKGEGSYMGQGPGRPNFGQGSIFGNGGQAFTQMPSYTPVTRGPQQPQPAPQPSYPPQTARQQPATPAQPQPQPKPQAAAPRPQQPQPSYQPQQPQNFGTQQFQQPQSFQTPAPSFTPQGYGNGTQGFGGQGYQDAGFPDLSNADPGFPESIFPDFNTSSDAGFAGLTSSNASFSDESFSDRSADADFGADASFPEEGGDASFPEPTYSSDYGHDAAMGGDDDAPGFVMATPASAPKAPMPQHAMPASQSHIPPSDPHRQLKAFDAVYDQPPQIALGGHDAPRPVPNYFETDRADADFLDESQVLPPPKAKSKIASLRGRSAFMVGSALLGAIALGGALAYAYKQSGGVMGNGDAPMVTADARPVKEAPDDPGGKEFPHKNKLIYDRLTNGDGPESEQLMPRQEDVAVPAMPSSETGGLPAPVASTDMVSPETTQSVDGGEDADGGPRKVRTMRVLPDGSIETPPPEAAAAEGAAEGAPATGEGALAAVEGAPPAAEAPQATMPVPAAPIAPQTAAAAAAPPPAPAPAPQQQVAAADPAPAPAPAADAKYVVQVGAKKSQTDALATFADIQQKYPSLLANYRPIVQKADLGSKGVWYRLRVGPIDDKAEAYKLCGELKTQGLPDCLVMTQ